MKKNDFYLIGIIIVLALIWGMFQYFVRGQEGAFVIISSNGEAVGSYSLFEETEKVFTDEHGGENILVIHDGKAYISDADCPDKLCVRQKAISKNGESIICLPHRLVIEITGGAENEIDTMAGL